MRKLLHHPMTSDYALLVGFALLLAEDTVLSGTVAGGVAMLAAALTMTLALASVIIRRRRRYAPSVAHLATAEERIRIEPSAELRQGARTVRAYYLSLVEAGFTSDEAIRYMTSLTSPGDD